MSDDPEGMTFPERIMLTLALAAVVVVVGLLILGVRAVVQAVTG